MKFIVIFQLLILGDCEVGKTCFIKKILNNEYNEEYNKTISFEFNWNKYFQKINF